MVSLTWAHILASSGSIPGTATRKEKAMNMEEGWYKLMELYGFKSITRTVEFLPGDKMRFVISWKWKDEVKNGMGRLRDRQAK